MAADGIPPLGERLREERQLRGLSLRQLARDVGVSPSLISQIETGKNQPSVSTLYALTSALGVFIDDLFETRSVATDEAAAPAVSSDAGSSDDHGHARPGPTTVLEAIGSFRGHRVGPRVRPRERQKLLLDSGVSWERLGQLPEQHVDFLLVTYAPGGTSSSAGGLMRHPGSEYGYLLRGELVLTLGFEEIRLRPGDAVCFESPTPHRYRNDGVEPAVGVWFVVEPHPAP